MPFLFEGKRICQGTCKVTSSGSVSVLSAKRKVQGSPREQSHTAKKVNSENSKISWHSLCSDSRKVEQKSAHFDRTGRLNKAYTFYWQKNHREHRQVRAWTDSTTGRLPVVFASDAACTTCGGSDRRERKIGRPGLRSRRRKHRNPHHATCVADCAYTQHSHVK